MRANTKNDKAKFVHHVREDLRTGVRHTKTSIEKIAVSYGITDKTEVKEYTELAVVLKARNIALSSLSVEEKYWKIVDLYEQQVNLSHRTSHSVLLQQYSTPAPISFLAGIYVNANENIAVFEPSAGNGLLTVATIPPTMAEQRKVYFCRNIGKLKKVKSKRPLFRCSGQSRSFAR